MRASIGFGQSAFELNTVKIYFFPFFHLPPRII